jgi:N-acetylmuramoyl-L-alanine amidase
MRNINRIIIHCSATPEGRDIDAATIRDWHITGNGWSDIGYHYVIKLNGEIESGRPLDVVGAHVKGHNEDSIGICYIGGMDEDMNPKDTMLECQEESLRELIFSLRMVWDKHLTIHGHNEYSTKACPSFKVGEKFKDIL